MFLRFEVTQNPEGTQRLTHHLTNTASDQYMDFSTLPPNVRDRITHFAATYGPPQPSISSTITSNPPMQPAPLRDDYIAYINRIKPPIEGSASLLDLPGELRNHIYELALFHEQTNGVISPLQDRSTANLYRHNQPERGNAATRSQKDPPASSLTIICGHRFRVCEDIVIEYVSSNAISSQALERYECNPDAVLDEVASRHLCTLECLLQPPLTLVNRQLRGEALATFYAANEFHFEMSNFVVATSEGWRESVRSPVDWWRAVGDTNLRNIRNLTICGQSKEAGEDLGFVVEYTNGQQATATNQAYYGTPITNPYLWLAPAEAMISLNERFNRKISELERNTRASLQPHLDVLAANGPHVRVLECIVAALEPPDIFYLRDESALEGPCGTVKICYPVDDVNEGAGVEVDGDEGEKMMG
ncbi:hypothetical protein LTR37_009391 [Vermiconidia calcicola]|uniref:Uncharacterized protein n=1 Tax=Vermiconidia calcicola TaxID=1690605 RepID=A0ACC3N8L8_9PEZI|nr:hypothetical protein LTR37_009391 [Vermiconidia calcicola]